MPALFLPAVAQDAAACTVRASQNVHRHDGPGEEWGQSYTADLRYILFTSNTTGDDELYLLDLDLNEVQPLTANSGMYGDWITYVSG
jgi:Tol biopolymer transport system component